MQRADSLGTGTAYRAASNACITESDRALAGGHLEAAAAAARYAADAAAQTGDWDRALVLYGRALPLARRAKDATRLRDVVRGHAVAARHSGSPDTAVAGYRELLQLARVAADSAALADAWHGLALVAADRDSAGIATPLFRSAIALRAILHDTLGLSESLEGLGALEWAGGSLDSALVHLRLALRFGIQDGEPDPTTALNVASLQRELGRPDSALYYAGVALPILRRRDDRQELARFYNETGLAYVDLSFRDARWRDSALRAYRAARGFASSRDRAALLNNIGVVHRLAGRLPRALVYYDSAVTLARRAGDLRGLAMLLNNQALVYLDRRDAPRALPLLREALRLRRERGDAQGEWQTLQNLGDLYARSLATPKTEEASTWYALADSVLRSVGRQAGGDAERLSYDDQKWSLDLYRSWSSAWLIAGNHLAALAAMERGRAQALLELRRAPGGSEHPLDNLTSLGQSIVTGASRDGRALLSYLMLDSALVTWLITPDGRVTASRVPITPDSISRLVRAMRIGIVRNRADTAVARGVETAAGKRTAAEDSAARATLSRLLLPAGLADRLGGINELVVVPQGMLALVPFAALRPASSAEPLGFRVAIRYAPSLVTLADLERAPALIREAKAALVVGDPSLAPGAGLRPLQAAAEEARQVAGLFGVPPLLGKDATEGRVRDLMPQARVIHLATHGITFSTTADYRESHLVLAADPPLDDGRLTVGELLDPDAPRLLADLVVLSACETALGNIRESEGTVGLQRAFLSRGARSVLVSLWAVDDRATALFMESFYRFWINSNGRVSRAEALRLAQRWLATETRYHSAWYWGAFQLVGGG